MYSILQICKFEASNLYDIWETTLFNYFSSDFFRGWRTDLPKGSCALVSTSVDHPKVEVQEGIQGVVLVSHFLIEPCGTGKSRIIHMSRTDLRYVIDWSKFVNLTLY